MPEKREAGHKQRLLEGAITCLETKGYARTTSRDIVAATGTNLASIGYHYGSKEHLLNVALTEAFQRWLKPLVALASEPEAATPLERLGRTLNGVMETVEQNRPLVSACLEAWAQLSRSEDLRAEMLKSYEDFREVIASATQDAFSAIAAPDVDADTIAMLIIAVFDGLLVRWQLDPAGAPNASRLVGAAQGVVVALRELPG